MSTTITGRDVQQMVRHWLETPVNGYLGSDYGQDGRRLLQQPQADSVRANAFLQKLRNDVSILKALPAGSVNLYGKTAAPDRLELTIEVAGQAITVKDT